MSFKQKLSTISTKQHSLLCVGLDTDMANVPSFIRSLENAQFAFNKTIIDVTHDLVCSYKINSAFYEAEGVKGMIQLKLTVEYIKHINPEIVIIYDAKRADIGNTNGGYVQHAFDDLAVDGVTVHPYLGKEALQPFLDRKDKGIIILCRTSNPGAGEFQDLMIKSAPLYEVVARHVASDWNRHHNCGLVVGATYPEELSRIRAIAVGMPLLIPGIGAQGGDIEKTVRAGVDDKGLNAIITSSRSIIFASAEKDFAQKAREEAQSLQTQINTYRGTV